MMRPGPSGVARLQVRENVCTAIDTKAQFLRKVTLTFQSLTGPVPIARALRSSSLRSGGANTIRPITIK
jgi:hypothetical protein